MSLVQDAIAHNHTNDLPDNLEFGLISLTFLAIGSLPESQKKLLNS